MSRRKVRVEVDAQHLTDRARRGRVTVDKGAEVTALHRLHGAEDPLPEWQTDSAARYAHRHAPDLADMLGLPAPVRPRGTIPALGHDTAEDLLRAAAEGADAARAVLATMSRVEAEAALRTLHARRKQREAR
ncbi:hypothetical protein [Actinomadura sediminis]|uniref:Transposase n=1 Tax=Actinomadura sediminis TaxID=1038904 RepID=A0ABW3EQB8_9ACTN